MNSSHRYPLERLAKYVTDYHRSIIKRFGHNIQDRYYEFKEYLNLVVRDGLKYSYYIADRDDIVLIVDLYNVILVEENSTNKEVALRIMHSYYATKTSDGINTMI